MTPWIFEAMFPYSTQFLFRTLMFVIGEDENLELLVQGRAPSHRESIYSEAPYYPADSLATSASEGAHPCLNPYAG
jgi:hypothetical protein